MRTIILQTRGAGIVSYNNRNQYSTIGGNMDDKTTQTRQFRPLIKYTHQTLGGDKITKINIITVNPTRTNIRGYPGVQI